MKKLCCLILMMCFLAPHAVADDQNHVIQNMMSMPLAFTQNNGQWANSILFRANAGGATMWFTDGGAYYQFTQRIPKPDETSAGADGRSPVIDDRLNLDKDSLETMMIKASFVGANPNPQVIGQEGMEYKCNYFLGNDPAKWRTDVPNYRAILLEGVYPGIDLKYYGDGRRIEYDFMVSPGADYSQIEIQYEGAKSMAVNDRGELVIETPWGRVTELTPIAYQLDKGFRKDIGGAYHLSGPNTFGFQLGSDYDPALPVIIDPVLVYSTYLGGGGDDQGYGIAVDNAGCAYLTGYTRSSDFPTQNPYDGDFNGNPLFYNDAFVTKLSASGSTLVYSTYLGGSEDEMFCAIAVDNAGCVYVTGQTTSANFPTQNPYDGSLNGGTDAFVTKLSASGSALVYSTYLGGSDSEIASNIAIDNTGCAYVAGITGSTDFPTQNPYDGSFNGYNDAFVVKLSASGSALVYSTYLGGSGYDGLANIAIDNAGCAYLTGSTSSTDFPTQNPYDGSFNSEYDVYIAKLAASGNALLYSTYLGGSGADWSSGIAVDNAGFAYLTGGTRSSDFPTQNPYDGTYNGGYMDAFVTKLSTSGNSLVYSTYLGSSDYDAGCGIKVDNAGCVYVMGQTTSTDFPTQNPYDGSFNGGTIGGDVFVAMLSASGGALMYSTYLGGSGEDYVSHHIAVDDAGCLYLTGQTTSADFPTQTPYDGSYNGGAYDGFVTKFSSTETPVEMLILDGVNSPIANRTLELVKLDPNYQQLVKTDPNLAEGTPIQVTTDTDGKFLLPGELAVDDYFLIRTQVYRRISDKDVSYDWYKINIDNGVFDDATGDIIYQRVTSAQNQTVILAHTVIGFEIAVSVEWDADGQYLNSLLSGLKLASNYMYDVFDGQAYLARIYIYDNKQHWGGADMRIYADNSRVPSSPNNLFMCGLAQIGMPRKWYAKQDISRNQSFIDRDNLDMMDSRDYRTKIHEAGHYFCGFDDEYAYKKWGLWLLGETKCEDDNLGFMDVEHETCNGQSQEPWASEMSNEARYHHDMSEFDQRYQYTNQHSSKGGSCWKSFENDFEEVYDDIHVAIRKPEERFPSLDPMYFMGPNNDAGLPNVNVGAYLSNATIVDHPTTGRNIDLSVMDKNGNDLVNVEVKSGYTFHWIRQGNTGDAEGAKGKIRCLGVNVGDKISVAGVKKDKKVTREIWQYGKLDITAPVLKDSETDDTAMLIVLDELSPDVAALVDAEIQSSGTVLLEIKPTSGQAFSPVVTSGDYASGNFVFDWTGDLFSVIFTDSLMTEGSFLFEAIGDSGKAFFFDCSYSYTELLDSFPFFNIYGPANACRLTLDSLNAGAGKVFILKSPFPPPVENEALSFRAGSVYSISLPDVATLSGENILSIGFADADAPDFTLDATWKSRLHLYHLASNSTEWQMLESSVDTATNIVVGSIQEPGIYAVFAAHEYTCGDANGDGSANVGDAVFLISYVFKGGAAPNPVCVGDANGDGSTNVGDVVYLIAYVFKGGAAPVTTCCQ